MIEKVILEFVKGVIDFDSFYKEYCENEKIIQCLENVVCFLSKKNIHITYDAVYRVNFPSEKAEYYIQRNRKDHTDVVVPSEHYPTVKSLIEHFMNSECSFVMKKSEVYDLLFSIVIEIEPGITYYHKYSDDFRFFIKAVPDYVAGSEDSCNYIEKEIISKIPSDLSDAKRVKLCKSFIRQDYHIVGNKYPHWAQAAEWPIVNGKPARYLECKRKGDSAKYVFEDVNTGNLIVVEQAY